MTLPELSAYLATQGIGTVGSTIFEDFLPPTPDACVALFEYGGRADHNIRAFGQAELTREFPRVQVLVRGAADDYGTPRVKIQDVLRALTRVMTVTLSGIEYYTATPLQSPFTLERDGMRRYVLAVNFEFFKAVSIT